MGSKRTEFEEELDCAWKILIHAKDLYMFTSYLNSPDTNVEHNFIARHTHLSFIRYALWKMLIIDLAKLFSDSENQKFNLFKLLGKLTPGHHYRSFKFNEETLNKWDAEFHNHVIAIAEIDTLRNKYSAHADGDPFRKESTSLTFPQIGALIDFANDIIVELSSKILSIHMFVKPMYFDSRNMDFVKILADEETRSLEEFSRASGFDLKDLL
ncbi:MAG: hypothetical protein JWQ66_2138 [Mucilaginibacter sp.]|nr:hypothetical protein [Mucilaginibacter sp.]